MTYSSTLAVGRQKFGDRNQNTTSFRSRKRTIGPVSNTVMLIILTCLLGMLYLTQVTKTNSFSYQIDTLQSQQKQLKDEHTELEVNSARLQSLERVKNSAVAKNMVSAAPSATIQN